jgi:hypothetical protein
MKCAKIGVRKVHAAMVTNVSLLTVSTSFPAVNPLKQLARATLASMGMVLLIALAQRMDKIRVCAMTAQVRSPFRSKVVMSPQTMMVFLLMR